MTAPAGTRPHRPICPRDPAQRRTRRLSMADASISSPVRRRTRHGDAGAGAHRDAPSGETDRLRPASRLAHDAFPGTTSPSRTRRPVANSTATCAGSCARCPPISRPRWDAISSWPVDCSTRTPTPPTGTPSRPVGSPAGLLLFARPPGCPRTPQGDMPKHSPELRAATAASGRPDLLPLIADGAAASADPNGP